MVRGVVSTIIPVHNRPQMLREAVRSVLDQTYRPIEIIIVDDGSTDETPEVGLALSELNPGVVFLERQEKSGPGPARERGRRIARGEFIQYLDSDDLLRPQKFELQVKALRENPDCGVAYGFICLHPAEGPPLKEPYKDSGKTRELLFPRLLADRWWNTDAPLYRRSVVDQVGPWSDLRWSQDWEYDARVAALGTKLVHVKDWVCDERHHSGHHSGGIEDWASAEKLQSRLRFFDLMLQHADVGCVDEFTPERKHFTRWIFSMCRMAAAQGFEAEAQQLFQLAERSAGECSDVRAGFKAFAMITRLVGWTLAGRFFAVLLCVKNTSSRFTIQESASRQIE